MFGSLNHAGIKASSKLMGLEPKDVLHPSNLGKLNGAINSSPNAKLAHIANGNFNGPVGLAAALALADYDYGISIEAYNAATSAADATLALAAAFDLIATAPTAQQLVEAEELTNGMTEPNLDEIIDAEAAITADGPTLEDVTAAEAGILSAYKGTLSDEDTAKVLEAVRKSLPTSDQISEVLPAEEIIDETPIEDSSAIIDDASAVAEES